MEVDDIGAIGTIRKLVIKAHDVIISGENSTHTKKGDYNFDVIIGHIEDLLIDDSFNALQEYYLETNWQYFDEGEENKHIYMDIFFEYTKAIEAHITEHLKRNIPGFSMESFTSEMERRKNELEGEVFDILLTLTDFAAFKELFLDYKKMKTEPKVDLTAALCITSAKQ